MKPSYTITQLFGGYQPIYVERENCCDEMAIGYLGDNIQYAKTLVKMQEIQVNGPTLALNFNHKNSFFSNRIKRILNMAQTRNFLKEKSSQR
ncbi:MAG: hypothetical protein IPN86_11720 [Saprospiraceae bacterium]|nr:hypothetical protein [Saprospiraceae bacterium]